MEKQEIRVAMITGGTGSLGKAAAMELVRRGWSIFLQHNSDGQVVDDTVNAIYSCAPANQVVEVVAARADLTRSEQREQLVEQALESFSRIDMLVNAATGYPEDAQDLLEMTEEVYQHAMATTTATLFLTQLVANEMVRLTEVGLVEGAKIVTINSISAYTTSFDHAPQCMSRAALSMMTRLFADRLGEHGIHTHEIRVGLLNTGTADPAHARYGELIDQGLTPLRRWGRPGDVARAVAAVADDLLDFSTGDVINVDGGFHLRRM